MDKMKEVLMAAMKNKKSSGDADQKSTAKGMQEAMQRARKKFLSEHPEAAKRPFGKEKPSKKEQKKEAKKRKKEVRKDSMSSKNNFSMDYVEEKNFAQFGWYQRKYANFARTKGAKDKKKRKQKGSGNLVTTSVGAGIGAGIAAKKAYSGAKAETPYLEERKKFMRDQETKLRDNVLSDQEIKDIKNRMAYDRKGMKLDKQDRMKLFKKKLGRKLIGGAAIGGLSALAVRQLLKKKNKKD